MVSHLGSGCTCFFRMMRSGILGVFMFHSDLENPPSYQEIHAPGFAPLS